MLFRAFVLLLVVSISLTPTASAAQDVLGFFFDQGGTVDRTTTTGPGQLVTGYLVLKDPSRATGIDSWECVVRFVTDGTAPVATWYLEGQALNALQAPSFIVGLGSPLPSAGAVVLASVNIGILEAQQEIAVHVLPHDPPSLQDPPVFGYPVHRPLYGSGPDIVPLGISSGCTGLPAAIINDDGVPPVVDLEVVPFLNMGLTIDTWTRTIFITNLGEQTLVGQLGIEGAGYSYHHDGQAVTTGTTMFRIEPGDPYPVTVHFEDTGTDDNPGRLTYEFCGQARETELMTETFQAICEVDPLFLDLGTTSPGAFTHDSFRVWNHGDLPLYLDVRSLSPQFTAHTGSIEYVRAHSFLDIPVLFQPDSYGVFEGTVEVSGLPDCGPVTVIGRSVDPSPGCEVLVQGLDFGEVVVGYSAQDTLRIQNTALEPLTGEIPLETGCPGFSIVSGAGPYELHQNEILEVVVGFTPPDTGAFDCEVFLGVACETASVAGTGVAPVSACALSNLQLDFGTVYLGGYKARSLFVTNDGNTPFTIDPQVQGPSFRVYYPVEPSVVAPGATFTIGLQFRADDLGTFEDVLHLGNDLCSDVPLTANVTPVPPPVARIGIYFDDSYQQSVIRDVPASTIPAYLVLKGANGGGALDAWSLCMPVAGDNLLVSWVVAGDALEAGDPPCHSYGLTSPLPVTDTIVLATMQILVLGPSYTSDFYLEAHPASPIPGKMVYFTTDGAGPLPMRTNTGSSLAAAINKHLPVSVELPTPRAALDDGRVHLTWNYFGDEADGFHVWRRIGSGAEARLTSIPVTGSGGAFDFTDKPDVFGPAQLTYVCAAVKDGVEIARGAEVTVAYTGQPRPLTLALKPNYPNPFNPSTTVTFEIAKAGRVRLTVFDLAGRQVAVLADGEYGMGYHEEVWLGKDASGRQVPSGPYYLRLESGGQVRMRQMMLLK